MKTKAATSKNAGTTSARIAQRRTGPEAPSPRWRKGIQAASPINTTPAARARAPVASLAAVYGREHTEREGERGAGTWPQRGKPNHCEHARNQRNRSGERVLGERNTA